MDREKFVDITILVIIAAIGLLTAYVTFGVLSSQASGQIQQYSVGGAIAGALISWTVLGTLYGQFRQSSEKFRQLQEQNTKLQDTVERGDELKDLRKRNEELQQKLIRSAPKPDDYEIEISEREEIVLARPSKWLPRGGIIFDFELPAEAMEPGDVFPAQFRVSYVQIDETKGTADEFYRDFVRQFANPDDYGGYVSEFIDLGGEPYGIRSLKVIAVQHYRIEVVEDPKAKRPKRTLTWITQQEFDRATQPPAPATTAPISTSPATSMQAPTETPPPSVAEQTPAAPPTEPTTNSTNGKSSPSDAPTSDGDPDAPAKPKISYNRVLYMAVACYNSPLNKIYFFDFWDDETDFTPMSAHFNQILRSTRFLA